MNPRIPQDFSDSDSDDKQSIIAASEFFAGLEAVQKSISILLFSLRTTRDLLEQFTDPTKKAVFLTTRLNTINTTSTLKLILEANKALRLVSQYEAILEDQFGSLEVIGELQKEVNELDELFSSLLKQSIAEESIVLANAIQNAKPEELASVINTHQTLFAAKKKPEDVNNEVKRVEENKNTI